MAAGADDGTNAFLDSDSASSRRLIQIQKRHCPHCNKIVSFKTFKAHKRLHYDSHAKQWQHYTLAYPPFQSHSGEEDAPTSFGAQEPDTSDETMDCIPPTGLYEGELT